MKKLLFMAVALLVAVCANAKVVLMDFDQVSPGDDFAVNGWASYSYAPPAAAFFLDYNTANVTYTEQEDPAFGSISGNEQLRVVNDLQDAGGYDGVLRYAFQPVKIYNSVYSVGSNEEPFLSDLATNEVLSFYVVYLGDSSFATVKVGINTDAADAPTDAVFEQSLVANEMTKVSVNLADNAVFNEYMQAIADDGAVSTAQFRIEMQTGSGEPGTYIFDDFELNPAPEPPAASNALALADFDLIVPGSDFVSDGSSSLIYNPLSKVFFDDFNAANVTYAEQEEALFGVAGDEQLRIVNNGGQDGVLRYKLSPVEVRNYVNAAGTDEEPFLTDLKARPFFAFEAAWLGDSAWNNLKITTLTDAAGAPTGAAAEILTEGLAISNVTEFAFNLQTNAVWTQFIDAVAADINTTYAQLRVEVQTPGGEAPESGTFIFDNFRLEPDPSYYAPTGFVGWAQSWGEDIGSETNDFDNDGLVNLHEYGLGGNPTDSADQGYAPTVAAVDAGGTNYFEVVYPRRTTDGNNLSYWLESTLDLVAIPFATNSDYVELPDTGSYGPEFEAVTNRFETDGISKKFIQLKMELK